MPGNISKTAHCLLVLISTHDLPDALILMTRQLMWLTGELICHAVEATMVYGCVLELRCCFFPAYERVGRG